MVLFILTFILISGFDPLEESSRGLADLLEKENGQKQNSAKSMNSYDSQKYGMPPQSRMMPPNFPQNPPPGMFSLA